MIIGLLCYILLSCKAQQDIFKNVKMDAAISMVGYLINLYGENGVWVFQPCLNKSTFVLESLNRQSFFVQDMINDLGYTFLRDIYGSGKRVSVSFYDVTQKKNVKDSVLYFYCKITLHTIGMPKKLRQNKCGYIVAYKDSKKYLSCVDFAAYVTDLELIN